MPTPAEPLPPPVDVVAVFAALRALVGHYFDGVDALAYVAALRDDPDEDPDPRRHGAAP